MKKLLKYKTELSSFIVACALVLATAVPIVLTSSSPASAASLPSYRYTNIFDNNYGDGGEIYTNDVTTDSSGNVYVVGYFEGEVAFDNANGSDSYSSGGDGSAFITKFDSDGSYAWTKTFNSSGGSYSEANGVAVDSHGNIYMTGEFNGTVTFDGAGGTHSVDSPDNDAFLTEYNSSGTYVTTKTFDASGGTASSNAVAVDSQGNVYITGSFSGTVIFDGPGGTHSEDFSNDSAFLTRFNSDGSYDYTNVFDTSNGSSNARANDVATDGSGDVYITGAFSGTVSFNYPSDTDTQTENNGSVFLTKFNDNGSYDNTKTFDTSATSSGAYAQSLAIDSSGNVYLTGFAYGTVVFDGPSGSDSITFGYTSSYLTKYNADGSYGWTKYIYDATSPSFGYAEGQDVAIDSLGDVYWFSGFYGTVTFDGPGGTDTQYMSSDSGAITKYNTDGSYGWTKILDSNSGSAVLSMQPLGGIATDPLGNVYITSFFTGTVTFDGIGGNDTQTDPGDSLDAFLTSYAAFIPPVNSGGGSSPSSSNSTAKAPDTGFGTPSSSGSLVEVGIYSSVSVFIFGLATVTRRAYKSNSR